VNRVITATRTGANSILKSDLRTCATLLLVLLCQFAWASKSFEARVDSLSRRNESFAAASKILRRSEINTPDELRQAISHLNEALAREKSVLDKSVIETALAQIYLMGMRDCAQAKRHSAAAVTLDPDSDDALEIDVSCDMCAAGTNRDYSAILRRLEKLAEEGRHLRALYSLIGTAYMIRSDQTNAETDMLEAKKAFLKAKERGEPEASPNALGRSIEELDRRLRRTQ
jgi:hypothetical protein